MHRTTDAAGKLNRWAARLLILISVGHLMVFTVQAFALGVVPGWFTGELRSLDTLELELSQSQAVFWANLGSFAVPLILLGALVSVLVGADLAVPGFVGYGLGVWVVLCSVILEPTGFPLGLIPAALLIRAHQLELRSRRSHGEVHRSLRARLASPHP